MKDSFPKKYLKADLLSFQIIIFLILLVTNNFKK